MVSIRYYLELNKLFFLLLDIHENTKFHIGEAPSDSLQQHLMRVADYVECGEGVWWTMEGPYITFFDGSDAEDKKKEGPRTFDFKTENLQTVRIT